MQYQSADEYLPVEAITFNHRQVAFYRAYAECPDNAAIKATLEHGIRGVRMLSSDCPLYLVKDLIKLHNLSHNGSGLHMWELMDYALELEEQWTVYCGDHGLTAANPSKAYLHHTTQLNIEHRSNTLLKLHKFRVTNMCVL